MKNNYSVNYEDEKLTNIQKEQAQKESEITQSYDNMINNSDKYYNAQIEASKEWANKQNEIQQANTNFAIEKIEQQKEEAQKDYTKEQKGAYADYMKQNSDYSANAEQMAAAGLNNTGYSETSKVSMFNTYQNRVATARETYNQAILNYNNSIKEAQLNNNSKLAEIAYQALQNQLELGLQGFQYKNTLIQAKQEQLANNEDRYNQEYQQMLSQINDELNRNMQYDTWKTEFDESRRQWQKELDIQEKQFEREMAMKRQQWAKEHALKQQQLQLERTRTLNNNSGGYVVKGNSNKTGTLSKTAQAIQRNFSGLVNSSSSERVMNAAADNLAKLYKAGTLTADELRIISRNLGIE